MQSFSAIFVDTLVCVEILKFLEMSWVNVFPCYHITDYDSMKNQFWMCSCCRENHKTDINHLLKTKVFLKYVYNIVRTVRGDKKNC